MEKDWKIPRTVTTELGSATVSIVPERRAIRQYLCPLCEYTIEVGERHVFIVPSNYLLRRHVHTKCLQLHCENNIAIKLHPNDKAPKGRGT